MDNRVILALKNLNERMKALEHTVNEVIVKSLVDASNEYDYENGLEEFTGKYGKDLEPYTEKLKILNGDDFDPVKSLYDACREKSGEEGFEEATYIANEIADMVEKLNKLGVGVKIDSEPETPSIDQLREEFGVK